MIPHQNLSELNLCFIFLMKTAEVMRKNMTGLLGVSELNS
jgi:hypothetical protein